METKVLLRILLLLFFFNGLNAQITMTEDDFPQIGDVLVFGTDTMVSSLSIGSGGADQVWDFSTLSAQTTSFQGIVDPTTTPSSADFPTADYTISSQGFFTYVEQINDQIEILGLSLDIDGGGVFTSFPFTETQTVAILPTTYGTTYQDTFAFDVTLEGDPLQGLDSIRVKQVSYRDAEIDGYGTILTPNGSFECLRQIDDIVTYDTTWAYSPFLGGWFYVSDGVTNSTDVQWLARESKGPIISLGFNTQGNINSATYAQVFPLPIAGFTFDEVMTGTFQFTDESQNDVTSWLWDFGDGNTSTEQNPEHTYASSGEYEVCLTVTNNSGSVTICETITVVFAPIADFIFDETAEGTFDFTDQSTNLPTSWSWDFGDANTSTEENPQHTYAAPGDYEVCLTATNSAGSNTTCQTITVVFAPVADFDFMDGGNGAFDFTDLSSNNPTAWSWDFGDTNTSTDQNPTHTFSASDDFIVCLTVTNSAGDDTVCETITVTSTLENEGLKNLSIFPNPANEFVKIKFENLFGNDFELIISNTLGQNIYQSALTNNMTVEVKDWAKGYYNYQILNSKGELLKTDKILIVK